MLSRHGEDGEAKKETEEMSIEAEEEESSTGVDDDTNWHRSATRPSFTDGCTPPPHLPPASPPQKKDSLTKNSLVQRFGA